MSTFLNISTSKEYLLSRAQEAIELLRTDSSTTHLIFAIRLLICVYVLHYYKAPIKTEATIKVTAK